jgi:hypothetical protein
MIRKHSVKFEVFIAVTMKNAVFWNMKTPVLPHRRHVTSPYRAQPVKAI